MQGRSSNGILVISEHVILKDAAYRERVRRQIVRLANSGQVHLLVFGTGAHDDIRLFKSRLRPLGLESLSLFISRENAFLKYPGFLLKTYRARNTIRKMCRKGHAKRILVENLLAYLPLLGTRVRKKCTVVLDYHGVVPEEVKCRRRFPLRYVIYFLLKRLERCVLKRVHGVVCVSHPFRDYLVQEQSFPEGKILVDPNMLRPGFKPSSKSREYYRKLFELDERFILVYSGSLMPHQCPDTIALLFKGIRRHLRDAYLLMLTHDQHGLKRFLKRHGPFHGDLTYMRLEHEDMPAYMSMGDAGILLREANLMNRVASPTKFPEYLACGVPVIISKGVGSATEVIERTGLGIVIDIEHMENAIERAIEFIMEYRRNQEEMKERCMKEASNLFFSKDEEELIGFYRTLEGGDDS